MTAWAIISSGACVVADKPGNRYDMILVYSKEM